MNHYPHHIGDYAEATAHLTFVEDAAYSRLLRKYYATEKPLPADIKKVQRLVIARTREERQAVEAVLREFFVLQDDGWHQARCDEEIARYLDGSEEREHKAANEAERMRRHRERRKELFAFLRERGLVPKWDTPITELERLCNENRNAPVTRTETDLQREQQRTGNALATANQNQNQNQNQEHTPRASPAGEACRAMRGAGLGSVNPGDPRLLALLDAGATLPEFEDAAREAVLKAKGFGYALAVLKGKREDAAGMALPESRDRMADFRGAI